MKPSAEIPITVIRKRLFYKQDHLTTLTATLKPLPSEVTKIDCYEFNKKYYAI